MNDENRLDPAAHRDATDKTSELDLSDEDILDAMRRIPGYLDISTEDFRAIYRLAHDHALQRLFRHVRAGNLMRVGIEPLHPDTPLGEAAATLARQGRKGLPVVDAQGCVIGMLTERDFLRRLGAATFLELLLRLVADQGDFTHRCHETRVREAMTVPPDTIPDHAGFREIASAFQANDRRSLPVVDAKGRLRGLLLRKDFIHAHDMGSTKGSLSGPHLHR